MMRMGKDRKTLAAALWAKVLVPLAALTLYLVAQGLLLSRLLPEYTANVSIEFVRAAWPITLTATVCALAAWVVLVRQAGGMRPPFLRPRVGPSAGDTLLVLLPLTPVVQYVINNQDILSGTGSVLIVAGFGVYTALYILALPLLLGRLGSARGLMIVGTAFTFTITQMAALSAHFNWFERGDPVFQLSLMVGLVAAGWVLLGSAGARFTRLAVLVFFLVNTAAQLVGGEGDEGPRTVVRADGLTARLVGDGQPSATPHIMFLVYDSYVPNETMLGYGIDNRDQEDWLADRGFTVYPHTYSVARSSIGSISRVLDLSVEYRGNKRRGVSGAGVVNDLLKSWGYENHGIFYNDYFFQGIGSSYDQAYPPPRRSRPPRELIVRAVFMGEFRFDMEFHAPSRDEFDSAKAASFELEPGRPRFVYVHDRFPGHSQNSGECRPEEIDLFAERLDRANSVMKSDVEVIMARDPEAMVIVAGDHGPHLTKNCHATGDHYDVSEIDRLDLQDRYGTFLAIRWPGGDVPAAADDLHLLQDLFPVVFAHLLGDEAILEAKLPAQTVWPHAVSGAEIRDGIIRGGVNDSEPLFER